jgi:uncharacterized delta-60 repeat protein
VLLAATFRLQHLFAMRLIVASFPLRLLFRLLAIALVPFMMSRAYAGPTIGTQPAAVTTPLGTAATLSVTAAGATGYQWVKNGTSVPSGTNATLSFSAVAFADRGNYYVLVTDGTGTTQSTTVSLAVTVPMPVAIVSGSSSLKTPRYLATDGTDWYVSGVRQDNSQAIFKTPVTGGTISSIYVGLATPLSVAVYGSDVYWIDPNAGVVTDTKILKAPKTGAGPVTSIYTGNDVGEPLVDGSGLVNDGTSFYAADEYAGKVFKLNSDGTGFASLTTGGRYATSFASERINTLALDSGVLYLADAGRSGADSAQPKVLSIPTGGTAFSTVYAGSPLVSPTGIAALGGKLYVADPGAGNTIWKIPTSGGSPVVYYAGAPFVGIAGIAAYNGELYVADSSGGAIYRLVQTAATAPTISVQPVSVVTTNGGSATFSVTATGIPAVSYVWNFNGAPLPGQTNATLALTNVQSTQVGTYTVTITNGVDTVTSTAASLTGPVAEPIFVAQPAPIASAAPGGTVTLSVTATGSGLTYQWRKYGQPIGGATNASLTLGSLTLFDAALYDVVVRTSGVDFPSSASRVTVNPPVPGASVFTASATFAPRIEQSSAYFRTVHRAADGKIYVAGNFTSLFGSLRPGYARLNADGSLDPTFTPVSASADDRIDRVYAFAVQADGKVLIGGDFTSAGGYLRSCLARLNVDGSLDRTFVPGFDFHNGEVYTILVQPDGKILAGGSFNDSGVNLARFNADGSVDTTLVVGDGFNGTVRALARQTDGSLLVGGDFSYYNGTEVGYLARLSATGLIDDAYRTAGGVGFDYNVSSLVLQSDGKLLVGGSFTSYGGVTRKRLARLETTGALDSGFTTGTGFDGPVYQIAVQTDGAILAAGDFGQVDGTTSAGLARLLSTGVRDTTFSTGSDSNAGFNDGTDGVALLSSGVLVLSNDSSRYNSATANVGPLTRLTAAGALDSAYTPAARSAGTVYAIAPAPSGRWFVAGDFSQVNGLPRSNLARLNADGSTDTTFVPAGTGFSSRVYTLVVQPDGKVVAGGNFALFNGTTASRIVRLDTAGALDPSFVTGSGFSAAVNALALQADGRIVVGGAFSSYNGTTRRGLVRLTDGGVLDPSFTPTGSGLNSSASVKALAVLADGRIYAGGDFTTFNGARMGYFGRFNADGTRDMTFASGDGFNSTIYSFLVQPDGKVVAAGTFGSYQGATTGGVARLIATGALDTSFATVDAGGAVTLLALQSDGKILLGGEFAYFNSSSTALSFPHLARLQSNGVLDPTFRVPGFAATPTVLQLNASGQLLVAGDTLIFPDRTAAGLALLEPAPGATILSQPVDQIASVGGSATFTVTATGANLSYQWRKNGVAIAGATNASYTISSAQLADAGSYSVGVFNLYGGTVSNPVLLTGPGAAPTISMQPGSIAVGTGASATFTVGATGATAYQWRRLGVPISGATNASFTVTGAVPGDAGFYDVLVANGLSVTRSAAGRLSVTPAGSVRNQLTVNRSFPAIFEPLDGFGYPTGLLVQPDGSYYIAGEFSSIDGAIRIGLARFSAAGVIDAAFAPEFGGGPINALARQSDGKLLVVGDFHRVNGIECNHLVRLNIDGTIDPAFLNGPGTGTYDSLYAVAVQGDGKVVIGGNISAYNSDPTGNSLARLNADGTLDTAFRTAMGTGFNNTVRDIVVHTDGRIYVVGGFTAFNGSSTANHVVALNPDGSRSALDGLAADSFGSETSVETIVVLSDGKMIVGGYFGSFKGSSSSHIVGLKADGSLDPTFAPGSGASSTVHKIIRASDGYLYVTGSFSSFDEHLARIARLTATGSFDRAYNVDGTPAALGLGAGGDLLVVGDFSNFYTSEPVSITARLNFARFTSAGALAASQISRWGSFEGIVETIVPAPGGKWLVGGLFERVGGVPIRNLVRLNADGSVDSTFSAARSPLYDYVYALAVQGDGKILVGGAFAYYGTTSSYNDVGRLIRLNADGTLDSTFALGAGFNAPVTSLALQTDGRIIVGGNFTTLDSKPVSERLVRLLSDGSLDASFQAGTGLNQAPKVIVVQRDDRLLIGGSFTRYNSPTANVSYLIRLQSNGVLDTPFVVSGSQVNAIVLQPNEDFFIAGAFTTVAGQSRYGLARFSSAGVLDATFNNAGLFDAGEGFYSVRTLALQTDGKIVVGGDFPELVEGSGTQQLARLTSTGALDPTFSPGAFYGTPKTLALQSDGSLLVGGGSFDLNTVYRYGLLAITGADGSGVLPVINVQPVAQSTVFGGSATFIVAAAGTPTPTYRWQRNGVDIVGATNASYTVTAASQATEGNYRVVVTNSAGSVTSNAVALSVVTRNLINFYARASVATGGNIASSFTIEGTQSKTVLIIGVGGARANSGSTLGALADPRLVVSNAAGTQIGANDNWTTTNPSALATASAQVAATPGLTATGEGASDAALLLTLAPGTYTAKLDDVTGGGGAALLQIYDADSDGRPRLVMTTLRAIVGSGANVVTTGFTLDGTLSKTVLLRALGQSLGASNGVLDDPVITLYQGGTTLDSNDDTYFESGIPIAFAQVGARPTPSTLDATLVETLAPGAYTVNITPFNSTQSGTVLFELFEADANRAPVIAPAITYLAPSQTVVQGDSAYFGVVSVAKPAATYQWRKDATPIGGATDAVLVLGNVQPIDIAAYDVVITSGASTITSPTRTLNLLVQYHSADTNHDHRISLLELTRVIQLYNYQAASVRTGDYHSLAGTEDGFTLGPGTRTSYHSADSDHDGRISPTELLRVIELYNYIDGTSRTGEYHPAATIDGFAPGPDTGGGRKGDD